ncbi:hypothetical protein VTL71DRAFT_12279 [Oculimacula yallundae]|uniref:SGF29 C-terminal domain-containing protein n=1 Tax=Oculimacula yallundae TaxID=86028 RepID=A0ABR4CPR4_9HELO
MKLFRDSGSGLRIAAGEPELAKLAPKEGDEGLKRILKSTQSLQRSDRKSRLSEGGSQTSSRDTTPFQTPRKSTANRSKIEDSPSFPGLSSAPQTPTRGTRESLRKSPSNTNTSHTRVPSLEDGRLKMSSQRRGTARNGPRGGSEDNAIDRQEMADYVRKAMGTLAEGERKAKLLKDKIIALETRMRKRTDDGLGLPITDHNELEALYREQVKIAEEQKARATDDMLLTRITLLRDLQKNLEEEKGDEKLQSARNSSSRTSGMDFDGPSDSPVPSPADNRHVRKMGGSRTSSQPPRNNNNIDRLDTASEVSERAGKPKILYTVKEEVAFKRRLKDSKPEDQDWIQGQVVRVIGEGKSRRYDVKDIDPDAVGDDKDNTYRSSASQMVPIPAEGTTLGDYEPGKQVLALYPAATTFYRAQVKSMVDGGERVLHKQDSDSYATRAQDINHTASAAEETRKEVSALRTGNSIALHFEAHSENTHTQAIRSQRKEDHCAAINIHGEQPLTRASSPTQPYLTDSPGSSNTQAPPTPHSSLPHTRQPLPTLTMGGQISKMMGKIFGSKEMRLLMLGLDAAGKTTILYKLKLNQDVTTIPTVGFNVETVTYKNVKFNVWDVGGQDKIRPLWRHYFSGTQGLIFVIDSSDKVRIDEARQELHRIINDREMKESLLLVFANKQDIPGAMKPQEVTDALKLTQLKDKIWFVVPSCATTGEGLLEGLAWLSNNKHSSNSFLRPIFPSFADPDLDFEQRNGNGYTKQTLKSVAFVNHHSHDHPPFSSTPSRPISTPTFTPLVHFTADTALCLYLHARLMFSALLWSMRCVASAFFWGANLNLLRRRYHTFFFFFFFFLLPPYFLAF